MIPTCLVSLWSVVERPLIWVLKLPVFCWRYGISPVMPMACRYEPSCSAYALEALGTHGPVKGLWLTIRRLGRCHPWGGFGYDPVPPRHAVPATSDQSPCSCHGTPSCPTNEI
jgi:uncharacterized protein